MNNRVSIINAVHKGPGHLSRAGTLCLGIFCAMLISLTITSFAAASPMVRMIELQGNRKISNTTILSKIKTAEGASFSAKTVQQDLRDLYRFGYFDDIRVDIEPFEGGVKLIYIFREKPSITSIDFQGNNEYKADELKENITLTPGAVANIDLIKDNAAKLAAFYQSEGYWLARVVPIIHDISEDSAAVTFEISEGSKVTIDNITIEGNEAISDDDILDAMKTGEWWIFSFLTDTGVYREDQMKADIMRIQALYQSRGYLFITVANPEVELTPDKEELNITIYVSEGDQYSVGGLSIRGNSALPTSELSEKVETKAGEIFNRTALKKDIDSIISLYMDRGYARADINPLIDANRDARTVAITLEIHEGGIFKIGRININGNLKTRDKVIRREMRLNEGDVFNKSLIKRSYQRINNLNFFENVDIKPEPDIDAQLIDLDVDVEEKLTGMLSIGGGYSSVDKVMATGEITQANLFGKGLYLKFKADISARRDNFNITLRDPWFMDKPVSASIGIYNEKYDYTDYDKKSRGGFVGFGKELSEYVTGGIKYNIEYVRITNVADDASSQILEQEGSRLTSSISPSIARDTRDNYISPTEGSRNALSMTLAGLGGDNYFFKGEADSAWFYPLMWDTTFSIRGRYGYATGYNGKKVPLYERFHVGGINTIRGLGFGEAGPRNEEDEKIGGTEKLIFNFEYIFPIYPDLKLKGVVFFDYGGSFDSDYDLIAKNMRQTAGAGVRWISPLGPIRLEWGFNLDPREGESEDKLEFSMGGFF